MQKVLLILGVISFQVAFGVMTEEDLRPANKECLKELNVDTEAYLKNINDDWTVAEGDEDFNRVSLCNFRKEHLLKDDDTLDNDEYKDALINKYFPMRKLNFDDPSDAALNAMDACKSVQGSDAGDTLVKHYNCIVNYLKTVA